MHRTLCEVSGCRGHLELRKVDLQFSSKIVGSVTVPSIEQYKCNKCDYSELSVEHSDFIVNYVRSKEIEAIKALPISGFISADQAAEILGISKQAFSKNARIKRGFILSFSIDGKKLYYKMSVELFKQTNDGRFLLQLPTVKSLWVDSILSTQYIIDKIDGHLTVGPIKRNSWTNVSSTAQQPIAAADNYSTRNGRTSNETTSCTRKLLFS